MFNVNLLFEFLKRSNLIVDENKLDHLIETANSRSSMAPLEKLQWIFDEAGITDYEINQSSLAQLNDSATHALVFIDLAWMLLVRQKDSYILYHQVSGEKAFENLEDLPVSVAIWLSETPKTEHEDVDTNIGIFDLIRKFAFRRRRWVFDISLATIMVNSFAVVSSLFAMQVYDRVVPSLAFETLYSLVFGIVLIYVIDFTLKTTRSGLLDRKSSAIDKEISSEIFEHLTHVQLDKLPPQLGTLTAQITGIESARQFFTSSVIFALIDLPFALLFLFAIYVVGGPIAFIYSAFFIASMIIGYVAQKQSKKLTKIITMRSNERMGVLVDTIKGAETIKSTGSGNDFKNEWNEINDSVASYSIRQKTISNSATTFSQTLGSLAYVIAIVVGVHQIAIGNMTMGSMIACSILGGRVLGPVGQAVNHLIQWETVRQSADLVNSFLALPKDRDRRTNPTYPVIKPRNISVDSLQFTYGEAQVNHLDIPQLEFHAGERVAILGSIGSGKSTLLKVLSGLYRPSKGLVKADAADLWNLDPHYLSNNMAYLPQSPDLFKGTLQSNLKLGTPVSDTKILSVIEELGLGNIMTNSEKGLDLPISEGGVGLSGGQRQLVALARLFIKQPSVWILDEPTASLDPENQERVKKALLKTLTPSNIMIFATHNPRLAIEMATRVLVMERGMIVKDVPASSVNLRKA